MSRLTDTDPVPKRLPPVYDYLSHPLLSLQQAVDPILSQIDQLDRYVKIAKSLCTFPSEHNLSREESAAVYLYTMEMGDSSFYQKINDALRSENRHALKKWFGYLRLFDTAIQKLPTFEGNVWRGATHDVTTKMKSSFGGISLHVQLQSTLFKAFSNRTQLCSSLKHAMQRISRNIPVIQLRTKSFSAPELNFE